MQQFAIRLCSFLLLTLFLQANSLNAQDANPWTLKAESAIPNKESLERSIVPNAYKTVQLDWNQLISIVDQAPMRFSQAASENMVLLSLPMPNGQFESFQIVNAPVMQPGLASKFPMIRSFAGKGIDNPSAYLRFNITQNGFYGLIMTGKGNDIYIDPYAKGNKEICIAYYKEDYEKEETNPFVCEVEGKEITKEDIIDASNSSSSPAVMNPLAGDCQLRVYRLALACVGEYGQFHGGTVAGALAAMATTMTRINGIYEKDFGVTMMMVDNNDQLVFLNPSTDPYSNSSGDLGNNQNTCDNVIGSANYDVGHLLTTSGGGIAQLNSPCNNGSKARGLSGQGAPVGDPYDVDYVAHEMGHQFGANHTQNNSCNRNGSTAMEPGSASTIMGYAGICNPNVQNNSDDHFHAVSIQEVAENITVGVGSGCPTIIDTGNNPPIVDAGNNYTLPISTPFTLTAAATDLDSDVLTYCWEQMDNQVAPMPPESTSTQGPAFRSNSAVEIPSRTFPNWNDLVNNIDPEWEELPSVTRNMNFRCTVRDNAMGAGCTDEDDVLLNFSASAGPFLVLNPNTAVTWTVGDFADINWDVANTDAAPVNCSEVNILLSTDGGFTYPIVLAENVPNTGNFLSEVPDQVGNQNRVMVVCADNIFFDISNQNFIIQAPTQPGIAINVNPSTQAICPSLESISFSVQLNNLGGFDQLIDINVTGLPAEADLSYSPSNQLIAPAMIEITLNNPEVLTAGTNNLSINATSGTVMTSINTTIDLLPSSPATSVLQQPTNNATAVGLNIVLEWAATDFTDSYLLEIATNPSFSMGSIVETATVSNNTYTPQNLNQFTVYYWRISGSNICGTSPTTDFFSFQTENPSCLTFESVDIPVIISQNNEGTYTTSLNIPNNLTIQDFNLSLDVSHSWVGDLIAEVRNPSNQVYTLFSRPGNPGSNFGCDEDNILVTFNDQAANTANDLENTCQGGGLAIEGEYQPVDLFNSLNGQNAQGEWVLSIEDLFDQDGGSINAWNIEICVETSSVEELELSNQILAVQQGGSGTIDNTLLQANSTGSTSAQIIYTITSLPSNGTLLLNGIAVMVGSTFSQSDIDNNLLTYMHDNSATNSDAFLFDVINNDGFWSNGNTFSILVLDGTLNATAIVSATPTCFESTDATATINAFGGTAPYMYSSNGVDFQDSNLFTGLSAGSYTFTIQDADNTLITTNSILINDPAELSLTTEINDNTVNVMASGGTGVLQYSIDGSNFQTDPMFTDLANGDYTLLVIDENDCSTSSPITISVNTLSVDINLINAINCFGSNDGSISAEVMGGMAPYQYSLDGQNYQDGNTFSGLAPGSYSITVLDDEGFMFTTQLIMLSNPSILLLTANVDGNSISVNTTGGSGNIMYSINGTDFQSSNLFTDLENGTYTVYVQDENMCMANTTALVDVTSIQSPGGTLELSVHPNPNRGQFTIHLKQDNSQDITLTIHDMVGHLLMEQNFNTTNDFQHNIDASDLSAGVYLLSISNKDTKTSKRIVIFK